MLRAARMKREMQLFEDSPPHGITCWVKDDNMDHLQAQILGPEGTPYHKGVFKLEIMIPERYPMEPPKIRFLTPIYHPNIDTAGRICLDSLKMPPKGAWKPALNLSTLLTTIHLLMTEPNPDDPLMTEIANEFRYDKMAFEQHAREWTMKHATQSITNVSGSPLVSKTETETGNSSDENESDSSNDSEDSEVENYSKTVVGIKRPSGATQPAVLQENVKKAKP